MEITKETAPAALPIEETLTQEVVNVQGQKDSSIVNNSVDTTASAQNEIKHKNLLDSSKKPFDVKIHQVDGSGNPIFTKSGRFKKKKIEQILNQPQNSSFVNGRDYDATAMTFTNIVFTFGKRIGGKAGEPLIIRDSKTQAIVYNEEMEFFKATKNYCIKKNIPDLPVGVALALVAAPYLIRVSGAYIQTESGSIVTQGIIAKVKGIFKRKKKDAARADIRNDGNGQNNTSPKESPSIQKQGN